MSAPSGWQGLLDEDEQILWQGQPDSGLSLGAADLRKAIPALPLVIFGVVWINISRADDNLMWLIGLLVIAQGLWVAAKALVLPSVARSRTWYTLTDRRAVVAHDPLFGKRRLRTLPVGLQSSFEYLPGPPGTVTIHNGFSTSSLTFERIADAPSVMAMLRQIQREAPAEPPPITKGSFRLRTNGPGFTDHE